MPAEHGELTATSAQEARLLAAQYTVSPAEQHLITDDMAGPTGAPEAGQ